MSKIICVSKSLCKLCNSSFCLSLFHQFCSLHTLSLSCSCYCCFHSLPHEELQAFFSCHHCSLHHLSQCLVSWTSRTWHCSYGEGWERCSILHHSRFCWSLVEWLRSLSRSLWLDSYSGAFQFSPFSITIHQSAKFSSNYLYTVLWKSLAHFKLFLFEVMRPSFHSRISNSYYLFSYKMMASKYEHQLFCLLFFPAS